jgi:flotillin
MIEIIAISLAVVFLVMALITALSRYRMCPPDKILVVYGKVASGLSSRCYHGGATFVMPVLQSYQYLDLTPITLDIELKGALSSQNIRIDAPASFTIGISTDPEVMQNAATRLLGRSLDEVQQLASEIIMGQMRVVFASMTIEEINNDREKLIGAITKGVEVELHKVGLRMINGNIRDIKDQSGYIDALGKESAARAINDAQIKVAQENQRGSIGRAEAERSRPSAWPTRRPRPSAAKTPPRRSSPSPTPISPPTRPRPSAAPKPPSKSRRPACSRKVTKRNRKPNSPAPTATRLPSRPTRS